MSNYPLRGLAPHGAIQCHRNKESESKHENPLEISVVMILQASPKPWPQPPKCRGRVLRSHRQSISKSVRKSAFYKHKNRRPHGRMEFPHARVTLLIHINLEL